MTDGVEESERASRRPEGEEVVEETINAYRVQKLANGNVRVRSGGHVATGVTYFEALERYAEREAYEVEESPEHLRDDKRESIHDGYIPLKSFDSSGFTPEEILDAVTMQPIGRVMEDIDGDESSVTSPHDGREPDDWRDDIPDETVDFLDALEEAAAEANCDVDGCTNTARHGTSTGRRLCPGHWKQREGKR